MKKILFTLLFISIALCQFTNDIAGWYGGAYYVPNGTLYSEGVTVVDEGTLAAESLNETDFATHAKWDVTNDLLDTGGNAAYIWSLNQTSTLTQIQANLATAGVDAVWYLFTYTVTVTTAFDGDGAATITTGFASSAVSLDLSVGTHSVYFKSKTTPVDFVISIVSGTDTEGTFEIDDVTLKQITGGNVDISGVLLVRGVDIGAGIGASTDDQKIDVFSISGDNIELSLESDGEATKTVDVSSTTAVTANSAKNTNVSTDLSEGTSTETTVDVNSSDGSNATLVSASTSRAGVLTKAKWDEIVTNNAKVGVTTEISNLVEDTSPQLGGDLELLTYEILYDSEPDATVTASGVKAVHTNGNGGNVVFGDVCYIAADGDLEFADASVTTTMPGFVMALATISTTASGEFLLSGYARNDTWAWTPGGLIYISITGTSTNTLTQTAPVGAGEQVQVVGVATHADRIYFNPSYVLVEI